MIKTLEKTIFILQKLLFVSILIGFGVILPLCFNNAYFDIMEIKANIANVFTIILLPVAIIILILKIKVNSLIIKNKTFIISIICFAAISILSCIISYDPENAFTGFQGWYIGTFIITSMSLFVLSLYDMPNVNDKFYIPVLISIGLVYIFGMLDSFDIDFFHFKDNIDQSVKYNYISTIGNINWYVGYLSLTSLFFISSYIRENNKIKTVIFLVLSILAIYNIASIGSDGIYLAIYFSLFALVPFILNDLNRLNKLSLLLITYAICLIVLKSIDYPLTGYSAYTTQFPFIIMCFITSLILWFLPKLINNKYTTKIKIVTIIVFESILGLSFIIALILVLFKQDLTWGTGRIEIWNESFNSFASFPIINKLFGLGPELLNNVYARLSSIKGVIYQTSHSEPIQLLLTTGIFGLLSWILCWKSLMIPYFNNKLWNDNKAPLYIALAAYIGQAFVNSATTLNIVTLVLFLILLNQE